MQTFHIVCLGIVPASLYAQMFTFGVQGGVPAQTPLEQSTSKMPFTLGPVVGVRLYKGISLESGVLFHRMGEQNGNFGYQRPDAGFAFGFERWRGRAVEIPFLLKYRFLSESRLLRPFVLAGPSVRRTSLDYVQAITIFSGTPNVTASGLPTVQTKSVDWNVDPVIGAGVSFRTGRFWLEPEVRYSYWGAGKHSEVRQNQVHFLFGLRF